MRGKKMIAIYLWPKSYDALQKIVEREAFNSVTNCAEYVLEKFIEESSRPEEVISSKAEAFMSFLLKESQKPAPKLKRKKK